MPFLQPASYTDAALDENSWWAEATWCLDAEVGIVGLLFHLNFRRGIKLSMQHLGGETSNIFDFISVLGEMIQVDSNACSTGFKLPTRITFVKKWHHGIKKTKIIHWMGSHFFGGGSKFILKMLLIGFDRFLKKNGNSFWKVDFSPFFVAARIILTRARAGNPGWWWWWWN